jgi:formylglycine-generating enzyme required for sulfatase activity
MQRWLSVIPLFLLLCGLTTANNLQITNVSLAGLDTVANTTKISFDVSWDNSWRDAVNWDAVWFFAKFSSNNGATWNHAWLNTTPSNHVIPGGVSLSVGTTNISANDRGMGVFLYRSTSGSGSNAWTNVQLRWEYGLQGVLDQDVILVRVFGVEMVYATTGAFSLGDGTTSMIAAQFEAGNTGQPFLMTSEAALTLGGIAVTNLCNHDGVGSSGDFFTYSTLNLMDATYPKGFAGFYCMKYEVTQEQYKDFLNTLARQQQITRVGTDISGTAVTNRFVMTNTAALSSRNGIRCDATLPPSTEPVTFSCDFDADGIYDEATDGQSIACNMLTSADLKAFLDWASLRPLSELEFEKVCRGHLPPKVNEWAWGDTVNTTTIAFANPGSANEIATAGANCNVGSSLGPIRAGAFATGSTSRRGAGASFYGAMELTGNLSEQVYSVNVFYTGLHGDGVLSATGTANVGGWPTNLNVRGGAHNSALTKHNRVSDRTQIGTILSTRSTGGGGRGVRTAP